MVCPQSAPCPGAKMMGSSLARHSLSSRGCLRWGQVFEFPSHCTMHVLHSSHFGSALAKCKIWILWVWLLATTHFGNLVSWQWTANLYKIQLVLMAKCDWPLWSNTSKIQHFRVLLQVNFGMLASWPQHTHKPEIHWNSLEQRAKCCWPFWSTDCPPSGT